MGKGGGLVFIDFSEQGNSAHFRREGWSGQESDRVWAIGPRSVLVVPLQSSGRSVIMEAEIAPCEPSPVVTGQILRVRANGIAIGGVPLNRRAMIRCEIRPEIAGCGGILELEFCFPGFCRPALFGDSKDDRPLSCWFSFVRLYTTDMYKPGPWFPPSHQDIPVIRLSPPFHNVPDLVADSPAIRVFGGAGKASAWERPDENNGVTWTDETNGQLELPALNVPGIHALRVDASPPVVPNWNTKQDLTILLNGIVVDQRTLQEPSTWVVPLPREVTEGRESLRLTFLARDTGTPKDTDPSNDTGHSGFAVNGIKLIPIQLQLIDPDRLRDDEAGTSRPIAISGEFLTHTDSTLPAAIKAVLGMDSVTLARGFESLGTDREFGLVQRELGLEVLNLFGFCEGTLRDLMCALSDDLREVIDVDMARFEMKESDSREYILTLPGYNLQWRMFGREIGEDHDLSRENNAAVLCYLRRKFLEGLRAGRKTYVLKQRLPTPVGQAAALLMELHRHGKAKLLCVEEASNGHRPGEVELIMPNLMRGYIERSSPDTAFGSVNPAVWLRVLANASILTRGPTAATAV